MRAAGWISIPVMVRVQHRDQARQQRHAGGVHGVGDAVGEQRVDAGPGGDDLGGLDAARGRVALARGEDVTPDLACHPGERAEVGHARSVATILAPTTFF